MATYKISDVSWDFDPTDEGEAAAVLALPKEFEISVKAKFFKDELADRLGDAISEQYGFCHNGFLYERID